MFKRLPILCAARRRASFYERLLLFCLFRIPRGSTRQPAASHRVCFGRISALLFIYLRTCSVGSFWSSRNMSALCWCFIPVQKENFRFGSSIFWQNKILQNLRFFVYFIATIRKRLKFYIRLQICHQYG